MTRRPVDLAAHEDQIQAMADSYVLDARGRLIPKAGMTPVAQLQMQAGCLLTLGGILTATIIGAPLGIPLAVAGVAMRRKSKAIEAEAQRRARARLTE